METKQAELFKVLSLDTRIRIVELLKQKGPLGANEMSEMLGITPSAVSQHLKILKHAGLVRNERKGYWIPYEIDHDAMAQCKEVITQVCNCGCKETCRTQDTNMKGSEDNLALLLKREQELQEELKNVQTRIKELKKEV